MAEVREQVPTTVGIFELVELSAGRWSMQNELTHVTHVTYGSPEEVEERARRQTTAWRRKIANSKGVGAAWRKPPKQD